MLNFIIFVEWLGVPRVAFWGSKCNVQNEYILRKTTGDILVCFRVLVINLTYFRVLKNKHVVAIFPILYVNKTKNMSNSR